ncbi:MAG TPA: protein kinase [Verrucomicrobiae bacterium]|nr:protein kinase [Verrucomicrobiae bacterium]
MGRLLQFDVNSNGGDLPTEISVFGKYPSTTSRWSRTLTSACAPARRLMVGFLLGEQIGNSGMATIFKAKNLREGDQPVAIKVPHMRYEADPNFFSRFQREEEIGRKLDHPFILKFLPLETKSRPYIVTEYLRGCTL